MKPEWPRAVKPFLTARWESLVLLNYACPPEILAPLVPDGTALDRWAGEALVSLVGFLFADTRVRSLAVPFHRTFEEVNLRFYVRRTVEGEVRRGVVFIRELVPRALIAAIARRVYDEPYLALPMAHRIALDPETGGSAEYRWRHRAGEFRLHARAEGPAALPVAGSEAQFITEHYWGYTRRRNGETFEYRVDHPPWKTWTAAGAGFEGPADLLYGPGLGAILRGAPRSALLAVGSEVAVHRGQRVPAD